MSLLIKREVILAKVETTDNVDAAPVSTTDAVLVEAPSWANEGTKMVERPAVRASLGRLKNIYAGSLQTVTFSVEIKGSGVIDTPPELGVLLRGCAVAETINAGVSVVYQPASTGHESLTIYYFQDGLLRKLTGAVGTATKTLAAGNKGMTEFTFTGHTKVDGTAAGGGLNTITFPATFPATDDVFNGQKIEATAGTGVGQSGTITDYVGATKVATVTGFTINADATTVFSIDNGPIDRALVTPTFDSTVPVPVIALPFTVGGFGAVIAEISLDIANEVGAVESVRSSDGYGQVRITGRDPNGSFNPEAELVAVKDFEDEFKTSAALAVDTGTIGTVAGNRYRLQMAAISYREVAPGDRNGVRVYDIGYGAADSAGDDEWTLTFS